MADTSKIELTLLFQMRESVQTVREYASRTRNEWLTSNARRIILQGIRENHELHGTTFNDGHFEYWLANSVEEKHRVNVAAEWNRMSAIGKYEIPEVCISILEKEYQKKRLMDAVVKAATSVQNGSSEFDSIVAELKGSLVKVALNKDIAKAENVTKMDHRLRLFHDRKAFPEKFAGIKTGFHMIDKFTGGLFPGELTLISAITGVGKSTFCKMLAFNIITDSDNSCRNVLHIANEENQLQVETKYDAIIAGIDYAKIKRAELTDEELVQWETRVTHLRRRQEAGLAGRVFVKEVPAFTSVDLVEQAYWEVRERYGIDIHVIVIDHLPHVVPREPAHSENDERFKAAADCKELARALKVSVLTPTQAATDVEEKQNRGRTAGKMSVYGSKGQIHVSNNYFAIVCPGTVGDQPDVDERLRDRLWTVTCEKNRDGPSFLCHMRHKVKEGLVLDCDDKGGIYPSAREKYEDWLTAPIPEDYANMEFSDEDEPEKPANQDDYVSPEDTVDAEPEAPPAPAPQEKPSVFGVNKSFDPDVMSKEAPPPQRKSSLLGMLRGNS